MSVVTKLGSMFSRQPAKSDVALEQDSLAGASLDSNLREVFPGEALNSVQVDPNGTFGTDAADQSQSGAAFEL